MITRMDLCFASRFRSHALAASIAGHKRKQSFPIRSVIGSANNTTVCPCMCVRCVCVCVYVCQPITGLEPLDHISHSNGMSLVCSRFPPFDPCTASFLGEHIRRQGWCLFSFLHFSRGLVSPSAANVPLESHRPSSPGRWRIQLHNPGAR